MIKIEDCIDKFEDIHGEKYDYSKCILIRDENNRLLINNINCKKHGLFNQRFEAHIKGHGCRKCGTEKVNKILTSITRMSLEEFKDKSNTIYNGRYTIVGEYSNSRTPIKIFCKEHEHYFHQVPYSHLNGTLSCPKCKHSKTSKPAIKWINLLLVNEPIIQHYHSEEGEYRIPHTNFTVDGFNSITNTIYEFHGDYWHGNPKIFDPYDVNPTVKKPYGQLFKNTLHKELLIRNKGYKYECIWEYQWNNIINKLLLIQKHWRNYKKLVYSKKLNVIFDSGNNNIELNKHLLNKNNKSCFRGISFHKKEKKYCYKKTIKGKVYREKFGSKIECICYKYIFILKLKAKLITY